MAASLGRLRYAEVFVKYVSNLSSFPPCTLTKRRAFSSYRVRYFLGRCQGVRNPSFTSSTSGVKGSSGCIISNQRDNNTRRSLGSNSIDAHHVDNNANYADKWIQDYLSKLCTNIKEELNSEVALLQDVSHYYFDGQGKYIRPRIVLLMAASCNAHSANINSGRLIKSSQETVSMISEMIHTASLIHDDVIDGAKTRRGKASVNVEFGDKHCILAGDYILSRASQALARLGNPDVVKLLAEVVEDLVRGEFMQLGSKEDPDERFAHYLKKTYKKTASLIACCCKAVAVFSDCSPAIQDVAFQYGKNVGMAFQLVDDVLDFVASDSEMGKPTAADLNLGLATAPVMFACEKFPELNAMIMRRFKEPGDVEFARNAVYKSDSISRTYDLANQYCKEAIRQINNMKSSPTQKALINITSKVIDRRK